MTADDAAPALAWFPALAPEPVKFDTTLGSPAVSARVLRSSREILAKLSRRWRGPAGGGGPPTPRDDQQRSPSIWDDPELWMLMIH